MIFFGEEGVLSPLGEIFEIQPIFLSIIKKWFKNVCKSQLFMFWFVHWKFSSINYLLFFLFQTTMLQVCSRQSTAPSGDKNISFAISWSTNSTRASTCPRPQHNDSTWSWQAGMLQFTFFHQAWVQKHSLLTVCHIFLIVLV